MPAKSCLLSARLRPRVARSERVSGLAIRMTSVLCSSPSAPMLTSLTIQATLPLHQREYRPENTSSGLAPPISRQSHLEAAKRFFRKMLKDQPLLAPDRIGTDGAGPYPPAITAARKDGFLPHDPLH